MSHNDNDAEGSAGDRFSRLSEVERTIVQVGLWLVPESGGSYISAKHFSDVLGGRIYSFTFSESLRDGVPAGNNVTHLIIENSLAGRLYCVPARSQLTRIAGDMRAASLIISHTFWRWGAPWLMRWALKARVPYWFVAHGSLDPSVFEKNRYRKMVWFYLYGRPFVRNATYVICASRREREKVLSAVPGSNCVVINWPVDQIGSAMKAGSRAGLRAEYGFEPANRYLLCLGRVDPVKRVEELVAAVCCAELRQTVLIIAGPENDKYKRRIERVLEGSKNRNRVVFLGPVYGAEKDKLLQAVDGFVSFSVKENFGYAFAESLAAGLPVIVSRGHDLTHDMVGVHCGWFLETDSTRELISAIEEFDATAMSSLHEMGLAGRQFAETHLTFAIFKSKLRDLAFCTIMGEKSAL